MTISPLGTRIVSICRRLLLGFGARARAKRFDKFLATFPNLSTLTVLDLGGEAVTWLDRPTHPKRVTILNVTNHGLPTIPWMSFAEGDACDQNVPGKYDIVYSNSVIEHVGGHYRRVQFASNVRRLGSSYWIQTPNRWFPLEPHWMFPGFQFLPVFAQSLVTRFWPFSSFQTLGERLGQRGVDATLSVELLSAFEMRHYFPDGKLLRERIGPFSKSLVCVRAP